MNTEHTSHNFDEQKNFEQQELERRKEEAKIILGEFFDQIELEESSVSVLEELRGDQIKSAFHQIRVDASNVFDSEKSMRMRDSKKWEPKCEVLNKKELLNIVQKRIIEVFIEQAEKIELFSLSSGGEKFKIKLPFYCYQDDYGKEGKEFTVFQEVELYVNKNELWLTTNGSEHPFQKKIIKPDSDKYKSGSEEQAERKIIELLKNCAENNKLFVDMEIFGEKIYYVFDLVKEIYTELLIEYTKLLKEEINETENVERIAKIVNFFENYGDDVLVKECAQPKDLELRKLAYKHRDGTVKELKEFLKKEKEIAHETDAKRDRFHKIIERFTYLFMYGKSKRDVRLDLEQEFREDKTENEFELPLSRLRIIQTKTDYEIVIGRCEVGPSPDGIMISGKEFYETSIKSKSIDEDQEFMFDLIKDLKQKFLSIQISTLESGGVYFHDGGSVLAEIVISKSSVAALAESINISFEECEQMILQFIDEKVLEKIDENKQKK